MADYSRMGGGQGRGKQPRFGKGKDAIPERKAPKAELLARLKQAPAKQRDKE